MTALAEILLRQGYKVVGSDTNETFPTDAVLWRLNIYVHEGFDAAQVHDAEAVIYSTAYKEDHVERKAAIAQGIPVFSYPEAVGVLFSLYPQSVSVAGSHGKTTTTSLLGHMLEAGGLDPTVIVGSTDKEWGSNARAGRGDWFVLETDEFQNKFQLYHPRHLLITNVDYDHPDYFSDQLSYEKVFLEFVAKIPKTGSVVLWGDDPLSLSLQAASVAPVITYGQGPDNMWRLSDVVITEQGTAFVIYYQDKQIASCVIPFPGVHYALDALGAFAFAHSVGVKTEVLQTTVWQFAGTIRRFEHKGNYKGAVIIDDFAHHPTEIRTTLKAIIKQYPERKLSVLFHPHTFSRTSAFLKEFSTALALADTVYLLPIEASQRERGVGRTVSSEDIVATINDAAPWKAIVFSDSQHAQKTLVDVLGSTDVLVTMGAGDVWKVADYLVSH